MKVTPVECVYSLDVRDEDERYKVRVFRHAETQSVTVGISKMRGTYVEAARNFLYRTKAVQDWAEAIDLTKQAVTLMREQENVGDNN